MKEPTVGSKAPIKSEPYPPRYKRCATQVGLQVLHTVARCTARSSRALMCRALLSGQPRQLSLRELLVIHAYQIQACGWGRGACSGTIAHLDDSADVVDMEGGTADQNKRAY